MRSGLGNTPILKDYFMSYERFDAKSLASEQAIDNIVWVALRRGEEGLKIGSAQVDMLLVSVV